MFDNTKNSQKIAFSLFCLLALGACSKSFVVTSEVPQPLIERIPVTAKLAYSDEFRNYIYVESGDNRALEQVDFGQAQVEMFDRVFENLFTVVDSSSVEYDLKIEPQILDFQYSVPAETKVNMYEIWLKYRLKIIDSADQEVADWVVKGYGKTPTRMLASQLKAFNTASNIALRDIGAQLAVGFRTQSSIEDHLASLKKAKAAKSEAANAENGDDAFTASEGDSSSVEELANIAVIENRASEVSSEETDETSTREVQE